MSRSVVVAWDDAFPEYDFGKAHPMAPVRVELTMALARELGVLSPGTVRVVPVEPASDDLLATVHTPAYVEAVRTAGRTLAADLAHGLGTADNPVFPWMHEASALVTGATVGAARAVWEGGHDHGVNIAGGLHHAMPSLASGFCVYDDVAVAIRWLLDHGARKVAYVDVDVHHGDGVQAVFYDDPRVLTVSLHETGRTLFPGTGFPDETGGPDAPGSAVNVALPPGIGDAAWLRAFHAVVPPVVRAFRPDVLVTQQGCDSHALDPLAHLLLSVDGQRAAYSALHDLAHELCGGRWVATGGGGYEIVQVVPRAWTHLLAVAAGRPLVPHTETTEEWRDLVRRRTGEWAPMLMTDGKSTAFRHWEGGAGDTGDGADRAVQATRDAVFALHGLDPLGSA
jgi:acetoin utilization protein AcuC